MAKRGTTRWFANRHEARVAKVYGGQQSPSSGAAATDRGDVRVRSINTLFECKHTGTFDKPRRSITLKLDDLEKIADEAWAEGREPAMSLSVYAPDSILADADGEVILTVRLMLDDRNGRTTTITW